MIVGDIELSESGDSEVWDGTREVVVLKKKSGETSEIVERE